MSTIQLKEKSQTTTNQFELIKGEFSPEDAKEIISHLIQEKINFHNNRSFSQILRSGNGCEWSLTRIEELKESKEAIKVLLDTAKEEGKSLKIKSNIIIEIV